MDDILGSPVLVWAVLALSAGYAVAGAFQRSNRRIATAVVLPVALFVVLSVYLDGIETRGALLKNADHHQGLADGYLTTAGAVIEARGEDGLDLATALLQISQSASTTATQARIAEAQTRLTTSVALLTTVLVLATVYSAWQSRQQLQHVQMAAQRPAQPEVVLIVPRRFRRMRRWLRPKSTGLEEVRL